MTRTQKTITGDTVTKYLEQYPHQSSLSLARMIYTENPLAFTNVEHVRTIIRRYKGANGERARKYLTDRRFVQNEPYMPEGEEPDYSPYALPKVNNRILFLCDIHLPFHDLKSVKIALEDAKDKDCNTVILGGDIVDFYQLSVFDKVPNKSMFVHERELFWQLIDYINSVLPNAKIIWIEGNHEYRFERYMLRKCAEIYGVDDFSFENVFSLRELGVEWVSGKRFITAGDLNIMHGHEVGITSSSVNPARGMYMKAVASTVFGHLHKTSEHNKPDLRGNVVTCYSVGTLAQLHPQYRPINDWNTGFALIEIHQDGFMVKNKKIVGGKIQ